jgi:PAS domain S-box-containing protein
MSPAVIQTAAPQTGKCPLDRALITAFLENVPDFVHFKDRKGRFIAVSASKLRRNGLRDATEIIGRTDFDFFAAKNAQRAKEDEDEVIRTGLPIVDKLEHVRWADGRETWSLINKLPLRNEQGEVIGTFGLTKDITEAKKMERALEQARKDLVESSRQAGMAEVATGVLHNVGNVLNSLNVSSTVIADGVRSSKADSLTRLAALLREHAGDLATFLTEDPKGRRVPELLESLATHFHAERDRLLAEIASLQQNVDHIKEIINMQQAYATMVGIVEPLDPAALMGDAVRMNGDSLLRHEVRVVRDFQPVSPISGEKGKVLQILVNLLRNAKQACDDGGNPEKVITLRVAAGAPGRVQVSVQDNGVGIPPENLTRIFNHGFTTKTTGHGFGLHSAANAAKAMQGTLTAQSDGPGHGATFTLELPVATPAA